MAKADEDSRSGGAVIEMLILGAGLAVFVAFIVGDMRGYKRGMDETTRTLKGKVWDGTERRSSRFPL